jgi:hypothetical protein
VEKQTSFSLSLRTDSGHALNGSLVISCWPTPGIGVGIATAARPGFDPRKGQELFLSPQRPDQSTVQWVLGALSRGVKRPWLEGDHSPRSRMVELYCHSFICLHGIVLN